MLLAVKRILFERNTSNIVGDLKRTQEVRKGVT